MAATPESLSQSLDTLYSTTWQLMRGEVVDNIFTATPLWYWLYSKSRIREESGGRWIGIQTLYAKNTTVDSVGPGGTVSITNSNIATTAKFDWKYLAGSVVRLFSEDTENKGESQIMNLMQAKLKTLELSLIDELETQAFSTGAGNGGLDILGLQTLVQDDPTANPADPPGNVGGIDGATNTWWRNQTRTWSTAGMPAGDSDMGFNMRILYNTCSIGNDHPTGIFTSQTQYQRYEASVVNILRTYEKKEGDIGFESLRYKGGMLTWSPSIAATRMYMLNERYLEFVIESSANFHMTPWKPIPNQLDRVAQVVVKGQLVTSNRRMQGVLTTMPS